MINESWQLAQGNEMIGRLYLSDVDQPWFMCTFEPAEGWEAVRSLFEEQSEAMKARDPRRIGISMSAINSLDLRLLPLKGGGEVAPVMIHIVEGEAKFRI
ncbi:hypothetical protein ACH4U6_26355 [Streptomyces netropsis]|uniref:hypothetical protein n=1 Tax=Streptomyces netropsis TaxID=55404 RepID=UPI0037986755